MSLITRDAKKYRSTTAQKISQNPPKRSLRDFLSFRHPNNFLLVGANNRNVIITYRFLAAPVQANRDFFLAYWLYILTVSTSLIYARVTRVPPRISPSGRNPCRGNKMMTMTMWYYNSRQLGLLQITTTCYYKLRYLGYYKSLQLLLQFTTGITIHDRA